MSSSTHRLLIVTPFFPPHPSPATHRSRYLARYAEEKGWECEVLTVHPSHFANEADGELTRLVPEGLTIHYSSALPEKLTRIAGLGDLSLRSYFMMRRRLGGLIRERRPHLLYFPGGPFYQFRLGPWARRKFGVPYVLDYTDPWVGTLTASQNSPRRKIYWSRALARVLEPRVVRDAAHVFAVSEGTNDGIRARHPEIARERFSAVPFGFEPRDFAVLAERPRPNPWWDRSDGNLHLAYVGAMLPHGYETVRALFRAVAMLRDSEPALGRRIRLHFFGTTYDPNSPEPLVLPTAREEGLGAVVTEHPRRIAYLDALNVLTSADAVLALGSSEKHYTASKIFPCLLSGRPVFAAYHSASTVGEILRAAGTGELVTYDDEMRAEQQVAAFAAALRRTLARAGARRTNPSLTGLDRYSARAASAHLFTVMSRVVSNGTRALACKEACV